MSIHTLAQKIKAWTGERRRPLVLVGILIFTAFSSFYVGYIAQIETSPNDYQFEPRSTQSDPKAIIQATDGAFIASQNGTKYYPKECIGAKRIKEPNRVYFETADDAESQGYSLASGC